MQLLASDPPLDRPSDQSTDLAADPSGGGDGASKCAHRRCVAHGDSRPVETLIRCVLSPDGTLIADLAAKLPGRGVWVSADRGAVERAISAKRFQKSLRGRADIPDGFVDQIAAGLLGRVIAGIGLARRAGLAVCGFEKVKAARAATPSGVLLHAREAAQTGREKLRLRDELGGKTIDWLNGDVLGRAFGRDEIMHAYVAPGRLARNLTIEARRWRGMAAAVDCCSDDQTDD